MHQTKESLQQNKNYTGQRTVQSTDRSAHSRAIRNWSKKIHKTVNKFWFLFILLSPYLIDPLGAQLIHFDQASVL